MKEEKKKWKQRKKKEKEKEALIRPCPLAREKVGEEEYGGSHAQARLQAPETQSRNHLQLKWLEQEEINRQGTPTSHQRSKEDPQPSNKTYTRIHTTLHPQNTKAPHPI